jgi:hypothetical protein
MGAGQQKSPWFGFRWTAILLWICRTQFDRYGAAFQHAIVRKFTAHIPDDILRNSHRMNNLRWSNMLC